MAFNIYYMRGMVCIHDAIILQAEVQQRFLSAEALSQIQHYTQTTKIPCSLYTYTLRRLYNVIKPSPFL